ncbi:MAG: hypothetical protein IKS56_02830 [Lachnospiraceae bacterium]|nr:hypothetical protein [Lachnospiraceae bacterium]
MRKRDLFRIIISVFAICQLLLFASCGHPPGYPRDYEKISESVKKAVIDYVLEQDPSLTEEDIGFYGVDILRTPCVSYKVNQRAYLAVFNVHKDGNKYITSIDYNSYYTNEIKKLLEEKLTNDIENSGIFDNVEYEIDYSLCNFGIYYSFPSPDEVIPNNLTPENFDEIYYADGEKFDFFENGRDEWVEIKINCFSGSDNLDKTKVKEFFEEHSNGFLRKWECVEYSTDLSTCTPLDVKYITGLYGYVDHNNFEYSLKSCEYSCEKVNDNLYVIASNSNKYSYTDNRLTFGPRDGNLYIIYEKEDGRDRPGITHTYPNGSSDRDQWEDTRTANLFSVEVPYGSDQLIYSFD